MKIISILLLCSSCTIIPLYKINKVEYCEQKEYDSICEGYNQ